MKSKQEFIKGVDISSLKEMLDNEVKYYDFDGALIEPLELLKKYGVNYIRLRLWNEPNNIPESKGYCNLKDTICIAQAAKAKGLRLFLDFHYSDSWADPKKQNKPKMWEKLNLEELVKGVYDYTKEVLEILDKEGIYPDMVQIGNEVRNGILFPEGSTNNWTNLVKLLNSGIKAVRDTQGNNDTKIVIHMDQGGREYILKEWFDQAVKYGLTDFDIIGLSYYPFWHGSYQNFAKAMNYLVDTYDKSVVIVETAHGWRNIEGSMYDTEQEKMSGFLTSQEMQRKVLEIVMGIVANLKDNRGLGVFYWEPLLVSNKKIQNDWGKNLSLVNENGYVLEGLKAFLFDSKMISKDEVIRIEEFESIEIIKNSTPILPRVVRVLKQDGMEEEYQVEWDKVDTQKCGVFCVHGRISKCMQVAQIIVKVVEEYSTSYNLVYNGMFEDELNGWEIEKSNNVDLCQIRAEFNKPFPGKPDYLLYYEASGEFQLTLTQKINIVQPGKYRGLIKLKESESICGEALFFINILGDTNIHIINNLEKQWMQYEVNLEIEESAIIRLGIKIKGNKGIGQIKDIQLFRIK